MKRITGCKVTRATILLAGRMSKAFTLSRNTLPSAKAGRRQDPLAWARSSRHEGRADHSAMSATGIIDSVHIIRLFELGYAGDIDLAAVCRLVNRAQRVIRAEVGDPVESIGEPDIGMYGYSRRRLFALFPQCTGPELLVGVTHAPIEDNLFSMTHLPGAIVLSLHETEEIRNRAGRSPEQYVAQSALSEFIQISYMLTPSAPSWHDLAHIEVRGCLFDFVPFKPDKVNKLRQGHIDRQCRDKLIATGVDSGLITAVEKVLHRIQVPTLAQSFADGLKRPVFSFVLGGLAGGMLINLVSSAITGSLNERVVYAAGVVAGLIALLVVGNWLRARRVLRTKASPTRGTI
jgi:hypothetical protein